jgi:hypothetical protein
MRAAQRSEAAEAFRKEQAKKRRIPPELKIPGGFLCR